MMKNITLLSLLIAISVFTHQCIAANNNAKSLPLLPAGNYVGMIKGFNPYNPPQTENNINLRWNEAVSRGMKNSNINVDWSELEPTPNNYNKRPLEEALIAMKNQGLKPFVVLSTIDTETFTLPADLMENNSSHLLKNGMNIDNPIILQRFKRLLNWVVPMIVAHGGWALSLGNEPDSYLADRPELVPNMVNFLATSRAHAHAINPNLAITMTLSQYELESGGVDHIPLLAESDVASFTYYGINPDYSASNPADANQEIDEMLNVAGDKFLILQELGASAGYEIATSPMNASFSKQKQFYNNVFAKMESEPRFRAATVFQLVDWDADLVEDHYFAFFIEEGIVSSDFIVRFAESLETTGLIHYIDGSPRPSWFTFIQWVERLR